MADKRKPKRFKYSVSGDIDQRWLTELDDPAIIGFREIPCHGCARDEHDKYTPDKRGNGKMAVSGKDSECVSCDGTGYEYEALVVAVMEVVL